MKQIIYSIFYGMDGNKLKENHEKNQQNGFIFIY